MYTYVQSPRMQQHSEQDGNLAVHVHAILPNNTYAEFPSLPMPEKEIVFIEMPGWSFSYCSMETCTIKTVL